METKTYEIPAENLAKLTSVIEKLNRKAQKLGCAAISIEIGPVYPVYYINKPYQGTRKATADEVVAKVPGLYARSYHRVTIGGEAPAVAGFRFVATLQHLNIEGETLNVLRTAPGFEGQVPEEFRTATPENCDHCKRVISTRKETFVVQNTETGVWQQVGRNCLADFLGGRDPHAVAGGLELLLRAADAGEEFGGDCGGGWQLAWPVEEFLAVTAMFVRTEGWMSRGKARLSPVPGSVPATADFVVRYLSPPPHDSIARAKWEAWKDAHPVLPEDYEVASRSLAHIQEVAEAQGM